MLHPRITETCPPRYYRNFSPHQNPISPQWVWPALETLEFLSLEKLLSLQRDQLVPNIDAYASRIIPLAKAHRLKNRDITSEGGNILSSPSVGENCLALEGETSSESRKSQRSHWNRSRNPLAMRIWCQSPHPLLLGHLVQANYHFLPAQLVPSPNPG